MMTPEEREKAYVEFYEWAKHLTIRHTDSTEEIYVLPALEEQRAWDEWKEQFYPNEEFPLTTLPDEIFKQSSLTDHLKGEE